MNIPLTKTSDALEIIRRRYFSEPDARQDAEMQAYDLALDVAQAVYDLRAGTGLDRAAFAARVHLTAEQVNDLEDADFQGDPVAALQAIAAALDHRLQLTVVPRQAA